MQAMVADIIVTSFLSLAAKPVLFKVDLFVNLLPISRALKMQLVYLVVAAVVVLQV